MKTLKLPKTKNKYDVYYVRSGTGCYTSSETYIGTTWAVSEKQACNNVRNRCGGGPSVEWVGDYLEEGDVLKFYKAYLAK